MQTRKAMAAVKFFSILFSSATLLGASLLSPLPSYSIEFPSTGNRGGPARTTGGGVRGNDCSSNLGQSNPAFPLTPLLPMNANGEYQNTFVDNSVVMQFYVPDGIDNQYAEVYVEDPDTGEVIYDKLLFLSNSPKIMQVSFPAFSEATGEPLEIGKDYLWEFSIICDFRDRGLDIYTSGYTRRLDVSNQLPLDRQEEWSIASADRYAQASIWQESLQILDHLKCNSQGEWMEFLNSVGLHQGIAQASLDQCSAE